MTMNFPCFSALTATLLLLPLGSAKPSIDIQVTDIDCTYRVVTPTFDAICNEDNLCTFGEEDYDVSANLKMTGVEYAMGDEASGSFYLDATLTIPVVGGAEIDFKLLRDLPVELCPESEDAGVNGTDCPADGDYYLERTFNMPSIENPFLAWTGHGWKGNLTLNLYGEEASGGILGEDERSMLGECILMVEMLESGKTLEESHGRTTALAAFFGTLSFVFLVVGLYVYCKYFKGKKVEEAPVMARPATATPVAAKPALPVVPDADV